MRNIRIESKKMTKIKMNSRNLAKGKKTYQIKNIILTIYKIKENIKIFFKIKFIINNNRIKLA